MNTLTKVLLGIVAALLLVFITIAVAVTLIFEPNDYRPYLVDAVENATGRTFTLDGDLGLKLFPCCGVSIGSASLGNPQGFPAGDFASLESAVVSVKIWPLITRREIQIGRVTLDGLDVKLLQLTDGRGNWEFEADSAEPDTAAESPVKSLTIEGFVTRNGNISFIDQATDDTYTARDINIEAGAIGGDAAVPVSAKLTVKDQKQGTSAAIELTAILALLDLGVQIDQPELTVTATGAAIPTGEADVVLTATQINYDTSTGAASGSGLDIQLSLPGLQLQANADASYQDDTLTASGTFAIPEGELRTLLAAMPEIDYSPAAEDAMQSLTGNGRWALGGSSVNLSDLNLRLDQAAITGSAALTNFDTGASTLDLRVDSLDVDRYLPESSADTAAASAAPTTVPFELLRDMPVQVNLQVQQLRVSGIEVTALHTKIANSSNALSVAIEAQTLGGQLNLAGNGNPAAAEPALAGRLELRDINPRMLLTALDSAVATTDPAALSRLSGSSRWRLGSRFLELTEMSWQLDSSRLTGSMAVKDFDDPDSRFELALDQINLDSYLAPESETAAEESADTQIPTDLIRELKLAGQLTAGSLTVMKMQLQNLQAGVNAANGVLRLEPLRASVYGGSYQGSIVIDATGPESQLTMDQQLSAVQIGELLQTLVDSDRLAGSLSLQLKGSGSGNTQSELLKALGGDFSFNLGDGVYHGMDIVYEIQNAQALVKRAAAPDLPNRMETPIRTLSFTGRMVDGVLGSDDLKAEIPYLSLGGKGGVNLVERTLNYQLNAQVLKTADSAPGSQLQSLVGSVIPLTIKGPMSKPKVGVDLQGLIFENVKEQARNALLKKLGAGPAENTPSAATTTTGSDSNASAATQSSAAEPDSGTAAPEQPAAEPVEENKEPEKIKPEDLLKQGLRDLFKKPDQ